MATSKFAYLPVPMPADADYQKQCKAVPGTKRPGQTGMSLTGLSHVPADDATGAVAFPKHTTGHVRAISRLFSFSVLHLTSPWHSKTDPLPPLLLLHSPFTSQIPPILIPRTVVHTSSTGTILGPQVAKRLH